MLIVLLIAIVVIGAAISVAVPHESDEAKIVRLKQQANEKRIHFVARRITTYLGSNDVYASDGLEIEVKTWEFDYVSRTQVRVIHKAQEVYADYINYATHADDAYGRRYKLGDDDDHHFSHEIQGYIPGSWEHVFDRLGRSAEQKQDEWFKNLRGKDDKKRFGL